MRCCCAVINLGISSEWYAMLLRVMFNNGGPRSLVTPLSNATPWISNRSLEYNFPPRFHKNSCNHFYYMFCSQFGNSFSTFHMVIFIGIISSPFFQIHKTLCRNIQFWFFCNHIHKNACNHFKTFGAKIYRLYIFVQRAWHLTMLAVCGIFNNVFTTNDMQLDSEWPISQLIREKKSTVCLQVINRSVQNVLKLKYSSGDQRLWLYKYSEIQSTFANPAWLWDSWNGTEGGLEHLESGFWL